MDNTISMLDKIIIERNKAVDSAVIMEIQKIAVENGIETKFVLNEKNIIDAIKKQIPIGHHHTRIDKIKDKARISICPSCLGCIITKEKEYPNFCTWCGQKLDWSK